MPMETEKPTTGSGGNTEGLSAIAIIGVTALVLTFISIVLGILDFLFGGGLFRNRILSWLEKRRNSDPRSADAERQSSNPAEIPETSAAEALIDRSPIEKSTISTMMTSREPEANITGSSRNPAEIPETSGEVYGSAGGDQSSQNQQADSGEGCGDVQAVEAENRDMATSDQKPYDIYLVSTSEHTPHVDKLKEICKKNEWIFTTPYDGKLGVPLMESIEEAVLTSSHVVLVITEVDCSMKNGKYKMIFEMALKSEEYDGGKLIPIRCCDETLLPLRLSWLDGSNIDSGALEQRMIKTIGPGIRKKREAQSHSGSGAQGVRDGADVAGGRDGPDSASAAIFDAM